MENAMLVLMLALSLQAATPPAAPLAGDWVVDLSATPAEPYYKGMSLKLEADGTVTGSFYDSEIQAGRWKTAGGRTCASFRTTDGAGPYHTSVCQGASGLEGQTWAEHRNFVFLWRAKPATAEDRKAKWW
ncbi:MULTISPECIES: hypothetical protein [unclassified Caulobacter]|uniref:hypothetical protein n=1 Tax=unclassified Caulobacter TaxID=2648921 RepID=UPI000783A586|nr:MULTISPECIES: hypothetical protein [unclassified Caulobacter]AZS20355.1 hypothetical protein CSW63_06660 [Caulobacter sp. FWC26]MCA0356430.1 hypothetical protein [Pseudomonadota bacterium]